MPAILDGYHWSSNPGSLEPGAGGFFEVDGQRLRLTGRPSVREDGRSLVAELPVQNGVLRVKFEERSISLSLTSNEKAPLTISFEWDPAKASLTAVTPDRAAYRWQSLDYGVGVRGGKAKATQSGWATVSERGKIGLDMAQRG